MASMLLAMVLCCNCAEEVCAKLDPDISALKLVAGGMHAIWQHLSLTSMAYDNPATQPK